MAGPLDLLSDVLLGPEDPQKQDQGVLGGIGDVISGLPETAGRALGMASIGGEAAQGFNTLTDVLGKIPGTTQELEPWQKALPLAGLTLGAMGAAMHMGGTSLWHATRPAQWEFDIHAQRGAMGWEDTAGVEGLTHRSAATGTVQFPELQTRPPEDLVWTTVNPKSARTLQVRGADPEVGLDDLARAVLDTGPTSSVDSAAHVQAAGFSAALGDRLVNEIPFHRYDPEVHKFPQQAPLAAAAFEITRFNAAQDMGLLKGDTFKKVLKTWTQVQNGEQVTDAAKRELQDAMVSFSGGLQWVEHPELALHPQVGIIGINADKGGLTTTVKALQFDDASLENIGPDEFSRRVTEMFTLNPAAMVDPMRANISDFFHKYVRPGGVPQEFDSVQVARDWYPQARAKLVRAATENGLDPDRLIATAAIMSGQENWTSNIPKAILAAKEIDRIAQLAPGARAGSIEALNQALRAAGVKASTTDIMRALLVYGVDNPSDFFQTGRRTGGSTYANLVTRFEAGEDLKTLAADRNLSASHMSQKQEAFDTGIKRTEPEDLADQNRYFYELLQGKHSLEESRSQMPIVVDRQAMKIAMGIALKTDQFPIDNKGVYDSVAQAYRAAAAEIGEVDGRPITPAELQAVTWTELRRRLNVVKPDLTDYTPATYEKRISASGKEYSVKTGPGERDLTNAPSPARWAAGKAPFVMNDTLVKQVLSSPPTPVDWKGFIGTGQETAVPESLNGYRGEPNTYRDVVVLQQPDGTFQVSAAPHALPENYRGYSPSLLFTPEGRQVLREVNPYPVAHVPDEVAKYGNATWGAGVDAAQHPWKRAGHWLTIMPLQEFRAEGGDLLKSADQSIGQFMAELQSRGITTTAAETGRPLTGVTVKWGSEVRVPHYMQFATADARNAALDMLSEASSDPKVFPTKADEIMPENIDAATGRQWVDVPATFAYANGPLEAPKSMVPAYETHFVDSAGNGGYVFTKNGDTSMGATSVIYMRPDFYDYLDTHPRLDPNRVGRDFVQVDGKTILNGQVEVVPNLDHEFTTTPQARGFWSVRVDGTPPKTAVLYVPAPGTEIAKVMYGTVDPSVIGTDPSRTVVLTRTTHGVRVQVPVQGEETLASLAHDVKGVLERSGVTAKLSFTGLTP